MRRRLAVHPLVPAVTYFVVAVVWIAVSDRVALWLFPDPAAFALAQTVKGWGFVAVSAALIGGIGLRQHRVRARLEREKRAAHDRALAAYQGFLARVAALETRAGDARDRGIADALREVLSELGPWTGVRLWRIDADSRPHLRVALGAAAPSADGGATEVAAALARGAAVVAHEPDAGAGPRVQRVTVPVAVDGERLGALELVGGVADDGRAETSVAIGLVANLLGLLWRNQDLWSREERARAVLAASEARLAHRLEHISALHRIDQAITHGADLASTLALATRTVVQRLAASAAQVLVDDGGTLRSAAASGFRSPRSAEADLRVGEGVAGGLVDRRQRVSVDGRATLAARFVRATLLEDEGVVAYDGVPLRVHGRFHGVLEVFHREPPSRGPDWCADLESLAEQIAIAIDQHVTATALRETNRQLVEAYDATIDGWAAALDLRDEETQGHSRRVTDLTVRLARRLGVHDAELERVRRGALLHDIGKMGVPDAILSKPGPLDAEEWAVMKQHPTLAHRLLAGTPFLRDALDIPYAHHERWDGGGYPRGLAGTDIPLAARIFAVVDVYDALSSDRPYRAAWPRERVLAHLRQEAGRHFDPDVVAAFLAMIDD